MRMHDTVPLLNTAHLKSVSHQYLPRQRHSLVELLPVGNGTQAGWMIHQACTCMSIRNPTSRRHSIHVCCTVMLEVLLTAHGE